MNIENLLEIMVRLRDPRDGCPWDREQDFGTIAPYTLEEAYEVADAIEREDFDALMDELGDLLFQVVFHAQMASERGVFGFSDVVERICDKMVRRHPHVFGSANVDGAKAQSEAWERFKHREREAGDDSDTSALAGIPAALPGLPRATKLGKRAAAVGFDWPELSGVRAKVDEELAELDEETGGGEDRDAITRELGDVLFAISNLARHLDIDPEAALRGANARFEARFREMERGLSARGNSPEQCSLDELDKAWAGAKKSLSDQ